MSEYRKKPVVIEAYNVFGNMELPDWLPAAFESGAVEVLDGGAMLIKTLEGVMRAEPGDWIIRGVKGELYPCKPDIFEATYEPATNAQPAQPGALERLEAWLREGPRRDYGIRPAGKGKHQCLLSVLREGYPETVSATGSSVPEAVDAALKKAEGDNA